VPMAPGGPGPGRTRVNLRGEHFLPLQLHPQQQSFPLAPVSLVEQHPRPLVVTVMVVVINPSTRGFLRDQLIAEPAIML
jgi:hypothetical protein